MNKLSLTNTLSISLIFFFIVLNYSKVNGQQYNFGSEINDTLTIGSFYSVGYCNEVPDITINPVNEPFITGVQLQLHILNINIPSGTLLNTSAETIVEGEIITLSNGTLGSGNPYELYFTNEGFIEIALIAIGTPLIEHEEYYCNGYSFYSTLSDCSNGGSFEPTELTKECSICSPINADFNYIQNDNGNVDFINNSSGALSYEWDFGDGNFSTIANPSHQYDAPGIYDVQLKSMYDNCSDSVLNSVNVEFTNLAEFDNNSFKLYPNPNSGNFTIEIENEKIQTISINDLNGRILEFIIPDQITNKYAIENLSPGLYSIIIHFESGSLKNFQIEVL